LGFGETMRQLEDIDLGYRVRALGHRILLRPEIQGTHLKQLWLIVAGLCLAVVIAGNLPLLRWLAPERGLRFTLSHVLNVIAAAIGPCGTPSRRGAGRPATLRLRRRSLSLAYGVRQACGGASGVAGSARASRPAIEVIEPHEVRYRRPATVPPGRQVAHRQRRRPTMTR
jgi:hypothetical protein